MNSVRSKSISPIVFLIVLAAMVLIPERMNPAAAQTIPRLAQARLDADFGNIPLVFVPNRGRLDRRVSFSIEGRDKTIFFSNDGLTYVLNEAVPKGRRMGQASVRRGLSPERITENEGRKSWAVKLDFVGARPGVKPESLERAVTVVSYFKGRPEEWQTGLPTSSKIIYRGLWPGIDLVFSGTVNRLKYDFIVHPGADPSGIKLAYRGAEEVRLTATGRLAVSTPLGGFEDDVPVAWQDIHGTRAGVSVAYVLADRSDGGAAKGKTYTYGFEVGEYDRNLPLVLDPAVLVYCGYLGGTSWDGGNAVAVDGLGNAYIAGDTQSVESTFPVSAGPDLSYGGGLWDSFVAKINPSGTAILYCGYIGGAGDEGIYEIAVDSLGNAYVAGLTSSVQTTFPVLVGPDLTWNGGTRDAFVAKVNPGGTGLVYCGYIGGTGTDYGYGIDVDSSGNAYVTGLTTSTESSFPETVGPDLFHNGGEDAFVAKVNSSGSGLLYCGYLGGTGKESGSAIKVDGQGGAYITGTTESSELSFPVQVGPDLTSNGSREAFVAKIIPSGGSLSYCGFIGGSDYDYGNDIAVDSLGNAYVVGETHCTETDFPVKIGPDLTFNGSYYDAYVAKVNSSGSALSYCGYIGGSGYDYGTGIEVDTGGRAYLVGTTESSEADFPVKVGPDLSRNGSWDAFVAMVESSGTALGYCGFIGGSSWDYGVGIDVDGQNNAYITGRTFSTESTFPVIGGPDLDLNGDYDAYVAKIGGDGMGKDDFLGTWDGQGVFFRNSDTGAWTTLASPASLITAGDIDHDGLDDLIGIWPGQGGVWVKFSGTGAWGLLSSTAVDIAAGDMNGDGWDDLLATWDGQGVYFRNSAAGDWVQLSTPASQVAAGNLDEDGHADLIGIWPGQGGVWVKYSKTGAWVRLSSTAADIAAGDMNGDGRDDLLATWDGQGVFFRNSLTGAWIQLATPATLVAAGDLNGDGADDLIGIWPGQGGVWVKLSNTGAWTQLSTTARHIAAGRMHDQTGAAREMGFKGGPASGPGGAGSINLSTNGPGGLQFIKSRADNLIPGLRFGDVVEKHIPGPGEPGFRCLVEDNLVPGSKRGLNSKEGL